tara:strand:- start:1268 stop:2200 length:933 start_codon:yes stop_codon:yes gene_type:complete
MAQAFPVKAVVQSSGEVVLAEFLESDFLGILDGGTGAGGNAAENGLPETATEEEILNAIKSNVRTNFNLPRYDSFPDFVNINAETPQKGRFALDESLNTIYYGTGTSWIPVGSALVVQQNITGEIEFGGDITSSFDTNTLITSASVDLSPIRSEINAIEASVGLDANGSYVVPSTGNFINNSTSTSNAISLLDTELFAEKNRAIGVEGQIISDVNIVENNLQNFEYTGHTSSQVTAAGKVGIVYDTTTGKFKPESDFGVGGFIKFTKTSGTRDDIPLTTVFTGNNLISGTVAFTLQNGTQDDIDLIANGV